MNIKKAINATIGKLKNTFTPSADDSRSKHPSISNEEWRDGWRQAQECRPDELENKNTGEKKLVWKN